MKKTISEYEFIDALLADENATWSVAGARALYEYLTSMEEDTGEEIELDVVALRCDFSEYPSLHAWAEDYFSDWREDLSLPEGMADEEDEEDAIRAYVEDNGTLIEFDGGVIVSSF